MLFKPFDYNPVSVAVKTGSYPIPAGRYAIVTAQVRDGGSFTIGGATALNSKSVPSATKVEVVNANALPSYTVPSDKYFEGQISPGGTSSSWTIGTGVGVGIGGSGSQYGIRMGPGQRVWHDTAGGNPAVDVVGILFPIDSEDSFVTATFYVPTGTTISGSGNWRATVSEYIIPT